MARHAQHVPPNDRLLGVVPPPPPEPARVDPLEEALALFEGAKTERQKLKALEQVRGATALSVRQASAPDAELLARLDRNVDDAERAYREGTSSFESAVRALQGLREALRQWMTAPTPRDHVDVLPSIALADGSHRVEGTPYRTTTAEYFAGVPKRYHDLDRYVVARMVQLRLPPHQGHQDVKVYEYGSNALVWAS